MSGKVQRVPVPGGYEPLVSDGLSLGTDWFFVVPGVVPGPRKGRRKARAGRDLGIQFD